MSGNLSAPGSQQQLDFAATVRAEMDRLLQPQIGDVLRDQDRRLTALSRAGLRSVIVPTSSYNVRVSPAHREFHLNIPSSIADEATIARIKEGVRAAGEQHGVSLRVSRDVRGGSNYVLEGRIALRELVSTI